MGEIKLKSMDLRGHYDMESEEVTDCYMLVCPAKWTEGLLPKIVDCGGRPSLCEKITSLVSGALKIHDTSSPTSLA
jgi:hypothetical protein